MPRALWIFGIALATIIAAGCAGDFLKVGQQTKKIPERGEDWGPTGRDIRGGYQPGVTAIAFGPVIEGAYRGRMFATTFSLWSRSLICWPYFDSRNR